MNNTDTKYVHSTTIAVAVLFQSKWRAQILCALRSGPVRLGQLVRLIPGASKKMLTQNLRRLRADGIVVRNNLSNLRLHIEHDNLRPGKAKPLETVGTKMATVDIIGR